MGKSLTKLVLEYLQTNKRGITSFEAFTQFGATRLSDIIYRLKKQGYVIGKKREESTNRFGKKVTYDRYYLIEI